MKNATRILSVLIALVLLCGTALATSDNIVLDSTFPIVKEPVSAHIAFVPAWAMVTSEYNEDTFWEIRFLRDVTNMDLQFDMIDPSTYQEVVSLMLAGGDLPDLVLGAGLKAGDVVNYGVTQGLLHTVEDLLEYMPTFTKVLEDMPSIRAGITAPDGHIYTFPTMSYGDYAFSFRTWINQVWLNNLGLENPTTVDELYAVLTAFKEQDANGNGDPNDEIPWSGGWDHNYNWKETMRMAYGLPNGLLTFDYTDGKDGTTIVYAPATDTYKDMLTMMNKMWVEGLIDPDYFTQSEIQAYAKCAEGLVGIIGATSPESMAVPNPKDWTSMNALVLKAGDTPVVSGYAPIRDICRAFISASVDDEVAAALANLVDYYYTDEAYITDWYGPELGSEYDYDNNGMSYDPEADVWNYQEAGDTFWWNYKITHFNFWEVPGTTNVGNKFLDKSWAESHPDSVVGQYLADVGGLYMWWQESLIDAALKYEVSRIPDMFMSEDDTELLSVLKVQLDTYADNMIASFVTGEVDIDSEWENFQATLEGYGLSQYVELYNTYYDVFKSNM